MAHAGSSASFLRTTRDTLTAFAFNLGGLAAGLLVAYQLGIFHSSLWAIALYPAVLSAQGVIQGLLSGRLSTALHLGTIFPRFTNNSRTFRGLIKAVIVLTFATSVVISAISMVVGNLLWGITFADFPQILSVIVATTGLGLALLTVTVKMAFVTFSKGWDPDIIVYPVMSMVATVFVTFCYVLVLNLFFRLDLLGRLMVVLIGVAELLLVLFVFRLGLKEPEFVKTIRESLAALLVVAIIVNLTGTLLRGIDEEVGVRREFFILYPALIGLVSDVGSVVGSTATTKLALGTLKPKLSSIGHNAENIVSAWIASILLFLLLALVSLPIRGFQSLGNFYLHIDVLLVTNVIAMSLIVIVSFGVSIITFQKGLDPGNFVIPIENAFAVSIASVALLVALALLGSG